MQPLDGDVLLLLLFACTVGVITLLLLVQAYMVCFLNRVAPRGTMEAPAVEGAAGDGCGGVDVSASWASLPGASCGWVGDEEAGDCVVCLTALGEEGVGGGVRVLPRCRHAFHAWCIGRWLVSHSVCCPICRTPARAQDPPAAPAEVVTTSPPRPPPPPPPPLSAAAAVRVDAETPGAVGGAVVGYFARRGAMVLGEHQITEELHLPLLLLY